MVPPGVVQVQLIPGVGVLVDAGAWVGVDVADCDWPEDVLVVGVGVLVGVEVGLPVDLIVGVGAADGV